MRVIGLCGGSGSGKGTVSDTFRAHQIPVLDTDALYHSLISGPSPCVSALSAAFGQAILNKDGSINRKRLADIVFADDNGRIHRSQLLNSISHRYVLAECRKWIAKQSEDGHDMAVIDAPMLYESGFQNECDLVVAVTAPVSVRVRRIIERDQISDSAAQARISAQLSDAELARRADYVLSNNGTLDDIREKTEELIYLLTLNGSDAPFQSKKTD